MYSALPETFSSQYLLTKLRVSDARSLWVAGPLDRLARLVNITTVVDECDVLLAVVSRNVALREEGKVCSLALFGNFTYAELHP